MITTVVVPLHDEQGRERGRLTLRCLHGREQWQGIPTLIDCRATPLDSAAAPVQLLEEVDYDYEFDLVNDDVSAVEPVELLSFSSTPARGRFKAGRSTGTVTVDVSSVSGRRLRCELEIRSRKLDYESDYRAMLSRIAREAAELVQSSFASSSLRAFRPDATADPETLYARYAFVDALFNSAVVQDALHIVERRPHHEHRDEHVDVNPAKPLRAGPWLAKSLARPGPRQPCAVPIAGLRDLPMRVEGRTHLQTFDTVPNRFVRYVLERWRAIAVDVAARLDDRTPAGRRGRREALRMAERLDRTLRTPVLREAGRLTAFPQSNQVLQGRVGYRDIFEAFLLAEAAATIEWDDASAVMPAGQRDVAALYEHWVFLELVGIIESLPGFSVDRRALTRRTENGLALHLRRQGKAVVAAAGHRRGRAVTIELWFNKNFASGATGGSWTEALRPDCSIRIAPRGGFLGSDTWLHFDAKYRMQSSTDVFSKIEADVDGAARPVPTDLLKMHAYRDAVRRTAGAYVLYPGDDNAAGVRRSKYHEILPGLGAFTLRPTADGHASAHSAGVLRAFLDSVIDHVAAQGTAGERLQFWESDTYDTQPPRGRAIDFGPQLRRPAIDTRVLLGFVRSSEHLAWIERTGLYNMRADAERAGAVDPLAMDLNADFVVLYTAGDSAAWSFEPEPGFLVQTASDLRGSGYPDPRGAKYLCLRLGERTDLELNADTVRDLTHRRIDGRPPEAPLVVGWLELTTQAR